MIHLLFSILLATPSNAQNTSAYPRNVVIVGTGSIPSGFPAQNVGTMQVNALGVTLIASSSVPIIGNVGLSSNTVIGVDASTHVVSFPQMGCGGLVFGTGVGNFPSTGTITAGTNVTVTNTCGGVTIASTGGGGGGGGGASTLAISTGTSSQVGSPAGTFISSPTAIINFNSGQFFGSLQGGSTAFVSLDPVSLSTGVTGVLPTSNGGTGTNNPFAHNVLIGEGASAINGVALLNWGMLSGVSANDPSPLILTPGNDIGISSTSVALTIAVSSSPTFSGTVNLSGLSSSLPLQLDGSNNIISSAINLSGSQVTSSLPAASIAAGNLASGVVNQNAAGGDLTGNYPNPTLKAVQGNISTITSSFTVTGSSLSVTGANGLKVTYGVVTGSATLNNVTGLTQCLHADTNGKVTGTGNDCGTNNSGGITVYSGAAIAFSGTQYFPIGGGLGPSGTEANVDVESPAAATITNFYVQLSQALGVGNSTVFTWRDGGVSQSLTCTISGASQTSCNDVTHSFLASQGDLLDIQAVTSGIVGVTPNTIMNVQYGTTGSNGTVNSGTAMQAAYYSAAGQAVSGTSNLLVHASSATAPGSGGFGITYGLSVGSITSPSSTAQLLISTVTQFTEAYSSTNTLVAAGTPSTFTWTNSNVQSSTLTANSFLYFVGALPGERILLILYQDATGSRTVTWPSYVKWAGGTAPTLTTTGKQADVIACVYTPLNGSYYCVPSLNFSP